MLSKITARAPAIAIRRTLPVISHLGNFTDGAFRW
jgi:hypothetical protein